MPRLLWNVWMYIGLQFFSVKEPSKNHGFGIFPISSLFIYVPDLNCWTICEKNW